MANLQILPELVKSKDHFETVLLPVDALEFFQALNFAQSCIDPVQMNGPKVLDHLERLNQLQAFYALYYADYMDDRINELRERVGK
ncbi:MAG: hypothetical protein WA004_05060 [Saprospiraceae bacterium]